MFKQTSTQVVGLAAAASGILVGMPGGYNRDLQDTKKLVLEALDTTRASLRILARIAGGLRANPERLRAAFSEPGVFATDRALELVAGGMPFRDAYHQVRNHLDDLRGMDPDAAVARKTYLGAPADPGLFDAAQAALRTGRARLRIQRRHVQSALQKLLPERIGRKLET